MEFLPQPSRTQHGPEPRSMDSRSCRDATLPGKRRASQDLQGITHFIFWWSCGSLCACVDRRNGFVRLARRQPGSRHAFNHPGCPRIKGSRNRRRRSRLSVCHNWPCRSPPMRFPAPSQDHVIAEMILPGKQSQPGFISGSNFSRSAQLCPVPAAAVREQAGISDWPRSRAADATTDPQKCPGLSSECATRRPAVRARGVGPFRFHPPDRGVYATAVARLHNSTLLRGQAIISLNSAICF